MAHIDEHCRDCLRELGEEFREVHNYIDEFFPKLGFRHRVMRHHKKGVEEVREKWGNRAAQAAEVHIRKDCYGEVPTIEQAKLWDVLT